MFLLLSLVNDLLIACHEVQIINCVILISINEIIDVKFDARLICKYKMCIANYMQKIVEATKV